MTSESVFLKRKDDRSKISPEMEEKFCNWCRRSITLEGLFETCFVRSSKFFCPMPLPTIDSTSSCIMFSLDSELSQSAGVKNGEKLLIVQGSGMLRMSPRERAVHIPVSTFII